MGFESLDLIASYSTYPLRLPSASCRWPMSPWIRLPVIARIHSACHRLLAAGRLFHIFTPLAIGCLHVGSESLDLVIDPAIRCFDSSLDFHLLDHRLPSASCRWPQHLAIRRDDSTLAFHFFPRVCLHCVLPRSNWTLQQEDFSSSLIAKVVLGGPSPFPQRSCHSRLQPFLPHEPATRILN
jgi:hypothetical protein